MKYFKTSHACIEFLVVHSRREAKISPSKQLVQNLYRTVSILKSCKLQPPTRLWIYWKTVTRRVSERLNMPCFIGFINYRPLAYAVVDLIQIVGTVSPRMFVVVVNLSHFPNLWYARTRYPTTKSTPCLPTFCIKPEPQGVTPCWFKLGGWGQVDKETYYPAKNLDCRPAPSSTGGNRRDREYQK